MSHLDGATHQILPHRRSPAQGVHESIWCRHEVLLPPALLVELPIALTLPQSRVWSSLLSLSCDVAPYSPLHVLARCMHAHRH